MGNPSRDIQHNLFPTYLVSDVIAHIYAGALCVITVSQCQFIEGEKKLFPLLGLHFLFRSFSFFQEKHICFYSDSFNSRNLLAFGNLYIIL